MKHKTEILQELQSAVNKVGVTKAASEMDVSRQFLYRVLSGEDAPSSKVANWIGYQLETVYLPL